MMNSMNSEGAQGEPLTELRAEPILPEPAPQTATGENIRLRDWEPNHLEITPNISPSDTTGTSTPLELPSETAHRRHELLQSNLRKARTTDDYLQRTREKARRRFLNDAGASFEEDYGLDELRAPPILPEQRPERVRRHSLEFALSRERRQSLEYALTKKPSPFKKKPLKKRIKEDLIVGSWITFLSIWGALARIGLSALSTYPGEPVFQLVWAQFVGCAIMGFLLQDRTLFPKEDRYISLYIGLTTGFCGSITSFSSFMWDCFRALANLDPYYDRSNGHNVLALIAQVIITLCIAIAALRFGAHIAQVFRKALPSITPLTAIRRSLDSVALGLAISAWAAAALMTGLIPQWRPELFTAVLAPVGMTHFPPTNKGALTRWQLSRFNPVLPSFPLGTFAANISATVLLGICNLIQSRVRSPISFLSCAVIFGIDNGFCGCLSTVSTFAVELDTLVRQHAYIYAVVSIVTGIVVLVLLVGVSAWSQGYIPLCGI
jgi:fluoride exporter